METNPTDKQAPRKWFTVNRVLLAGVMILQILILVELYHNHELQKADPRRLTKSIDTGFLKPAGHPTAIVGVPVAHMPLTIGQPLLDDPTWNVLRPPPIFQAQEVHEEMNRMLETMYDQFSEMERLLDTDNGWNSLMTSPTMDMREQGDSYVLDFSLPGIDASEIEVALEGRLLTVYTSIDEQAPNRRSLSRFERKVLLPGPVEGADSAHAMVTNGVLKVIIPKAKQSGTDPRPGRILSGKTSQGAAGPPGSIH